jgi:hypothetical protein
MHHRAPVLRRVQMNAVHRLARLSRVVMKVQHGLSAPGLMTLAMRSNLLQEMARVRCRVRKPAPTVHAVRAPIELEFESFRHMKKGVANATPFLRGFIVV